MTIAGFELQIEMEQSARGTEVFLGFTSTNIEVHADGRAQMANTNSDALNDAENLRFKIIHGAPLSAGALDLESAIGCNGYSVRRLDAFKSANDQYALTSDNVGLHSMVRTDLALKRSAGRPWEEHARVRPRWRFTVQNFNVPLCQDGDKKFFTLIVEEFCCRCAWSTLRLHAMRILRYFKCFLLLAIASG